MRLALLIALLPSLSAAQSFGFSEGVHAVDVGGEGRRFQSRACSACHVEIAEQWRSSRHAQAATNATFQRGFDAEPSARCVRCHAPMKDQVREIFAVMPRGSLQSKKAAHASSALTGERAAEGIGCATCHVREGTVQSLHEVTTKAHATKRADDVRAPEFCAGCHEFRFEKTVGKKRELSANATQTTYSEWKVYREAGGVETCQSCHFRNGDHRAHGARDAQTLSKALNVKQEGSALLLTSVNVGHELPTGDIFRHLTVEVQRDGRFETIATLGRVFAPDEELVPALIRNTSLRPGETRRIELPSADSEWRIRYHFVREVADESSLPADAKPLVLTRSQPLAAR